MEFTLSVVRARKSPDRSLHHPSFIKLVSPDTSFLPQYTELVTILLSFHWCYSYAIIVQLIDIKLY